jgi:hypothetical protein
MIGWKHVLGDNGQLVCVLGEMSGGEYGVLNLRDVPHFEFRTSMELRESPSLSLIDIVIMVS